jgi:hypothetical protein
MLEYPPERIINLDETNWRSVSPGFWTGTESVCCGTEKDEKKRVTVIASVDAAGTKLLFIIGEGQTPRCSFAFNLPPEVSTATSQFGWTTSDVMSRYFRLLRKYLYPTGPVFVILDTYVAHRATVTKAAVVCGIELIFIPQGARINCNHSTGGFSGF